MQLSGGTIYCVSVLCDNREIFVIDPGLTNVHRPKMEWQFRGSGTHVLANNTDHGGFNPIVGNGQLLVCKLMHIPSTALRLPGVSSDLHVDAFVHTSLHDPLMQCKR